MENTQHQQRAVVFAGDYNYIRYIEAAMKSLCYHNSHLKIYVFNQDIPKEWFLHHKKLLRQIGSDLVDVKLLDDRLSKNWTFAPNLFHINYMAYARYFIPQFVAEDTVLYLDSDIVVTGDLSELFSLDLSNHYLAAVRDAFGYGQGFNSGVMVINNKRWREEGVQHRLIEMTNQDIDQGDQIILNRLFTSHYIQLEYTYNFTIGFDRSAATYGHKKIFEMDLSVLPRIIHYTTDNKPWNTHSSMRLREVWWKYHLLEWSAILEKWSALRLPEEEEKPRKSVLMITNTHILEHIMYLVTSLPDIDFHIAAFTGMAASLLSLEAYDNVYLHPFVLGYNLEQRIINNMDAYLDINHGSKLDELLAVVKTTGKPVYSFDWTKAPIFEGYEQQTVVAGNQPAAMVELLQEL